MFNRCHLRTSWNVNWTDNCFISTSMMSIYFIYYLQQSSGISDTGDPAEVARLQQLQAAAAHWQQVQHQRASFQYQALMQEHAQLQRVLQQYQQIIQQPAHLQVFTLLFAFKIVWSLLMLLQHLIIGCFKPYNAVLIQIFCFYCQTVESHIIVTH